MGVAGKTTAERTRVKRKDCSRTRTTRTPAGCGPSPAYGRSCALLARLHATCDLSGSWRCACREPRPRRSRRMFVFVEDAAEASAFPYVEVGYPLRVSERDRQRPERTGVGDAARAEDSSALVGGSARVDRGRAGSRAGEVGDQHGMMVRRAAATCLSGCDERVRDVAAAAEERPRQGRRDPRPAPSDHGAEAPTRQGRGVIQPE